MSHANFAILPTESATEIRLIQNGTPVPVTEWPRANHPGADICQFWLVQGEAIEEEALLLVDHAAIARLSAGDAARLGLPPASQLRAVVEGAGFMVHPDFKISLRWTRPTGQNVLGVARTGAWLREAEGWRRLPETLFAIAEAVEKHQRATDQAEKLNAIAALTQVLPQAALSGNAETIGLIGSITIAEADGLSLDCTGEGDALRIIPVLHRAGEAPDATPLLSPEQQRAFAHGQFSKFPHARAVYSLPGGVYLTIAPALRQALDVVRRMEGASVAARKAFLREPRPAIRAAIGDEADAALLEKLIVETQAWSDRVIGLGLWKRRVLPWVDLPSNPWFEGTANDAPVPRGIIVGDVHIPLTPKEASQLVNDIEEARCTGTPAIVWPTENGPCRIPADEATRQALMELASARNGKARPVAAPEALLIKDNEKDAEMHAMVQVRPAPPVRLPLSLKTPLKDHQKTGVIWLQQSWIAGNPGVLLADDMGLGKTLQGLAFLAWLHEAMQAGRMPRQPLLIVAPTGLLSNWLMEQTIHLNAPGLGVPVLAFGKGLADLRQGTGRLETAALRQADWVLTTYETLRDYDQDFGAVHFGVILMDEAQKIKTPGTRMTDAAKAMKADFRIAMTGTPVENRLSDLWCIVDCVAPGHLNDLRYFSRRYEAELDEVRMAELKATLEKGAQRRPPLLLRRLKEHELPDLPACTIEIAREEMNGPQLAAYESALTAARGDSTAGRVLEALQRMRAVSLHPNTTSETDDTSFIAHSARLRVALRALDLIAAAGERALVFVDSLDMMACLAGLLQRRYALPSPPMTISGKVAGPLRQDRVNRFQEGPAGFDVMLLSPRAGGVGLTLTRANHVVHLTRWWNPAVEDQATARVLRIGQQKPVTVHIPLATLPGGRPSFDENLDALLRRKRQLMRDALFPAEANANELTQMLSDTIA